MRFAAWSQSRAQPRLLTIRRPEFSQYSGPIYQTAMNSKNEPKIVWTCLACVHIVESPQTADSRNPRLHFAHKVEKKPSTRCFLLDAFTRDLLLGAF